jgi:hypothetical protein
MARKHVEQRLPTQDLCHRYLPAHPYLDLFLVTAIVNHWRFVLRGLNVEHRAVSQRVASGVRIWRGIGDSQEVAQAGHTHRSTTDLDLIGVARQISKTCRARRDLCDEQPPSHSQSR